MDYLILTDHHLSLHKIIKLTKKYFKVTFNLKTLEFEFYDRSIAFHSIRERSITVIKLKRRLRKLNTLERLGA